MEALLHNQVCHGKAVIITCSECVFVALDIHHTQLIRRIILSYMALTDIPIFLTLSHKRHDLKRKVVERKFLQILSENFFILRKTELDIIINVLKSLCKVPVILVLFS
jgi:hypothetical protein